MMGQMHRYFVQDFPAAAYVGPNVGAQGAQLPYVFAVLEGVPVSGLSAPFAGRLSAPGAQVALLHFGLPPNFHQSRIQIGRFWLRRLNQFCNLEFSKFTFRRIFLPRSDPRAGHRGQRMRLYLNVETRLAGRSHWVSLSHKADVGLKSGFQEVRTKIFRVWVAFVGRRRVKLVPDNSAGGGHNHVECVWGTEGW
ncbi:MAG: hypothetical protein WCA78_05860 [Rhizomicrobium sp.]